MEVNIKGTHANFNSGEIVIALISRASYAHDHHHLILLPPKKSYFGKHRNEVIISFATKRKNRFL